MITQKKHTKHTRLTRPQIGSYSRCEIGILGAPCDLIKKLVNKISEQVDRTISYLDADHMTTDKPGYQVMTDGINHHRLSFSSPLNIYQQQALLTQHDITIVNCNHFDAGHQIICCTKKKEESLSRKLDKLTDVKLVLLDEDVEKPFGFLQEIINNQQPLVTSINDITSISDGIMKLYNSSEPIIKGLVMAGGKSVRMGNDKTTLDYHGLPQWKYVYQQLESLGLETYVSCRQEQKDAFDGGTNTIADSFLDLGPYGALLSAFRSDPNAAWLSIACDLPLLNVTHMSKLIAAVDYSKLATSYHNPTTNWPEPMVTIWMPKAYPILLQFLSQGYSCPRKVLINSDVKQLYEDDTSFLHNANTPEDRQSAITMINK